MVLLTSTIDTKQIVKILTSMHIARFADEKMTKLVRQNKGATFHISAIGHEMIGTIAGHCLESGKDWGLPYYRDRAFALALGCPLEDLFAAFLARDIPYHSGGRMMPEHFVHNELRIPCQSSCVGSQFLHAVGVALGALQRKTDEVVYVSAGDGATSQGDFHEAINFSCIHKLPVIFVIQDNEWAISVSQKEQTAGSDIAKMVSGYEGLHIFPIDGCDYEQCIFAMNEAISLGRKRQGPSIIIAKVPRIGAHSSSDDPQKYKSDRVIAEEKAKDPLVRLEKWVIEEKICTEATLAEIRKSCKEMVEDAAKKGESIPFPPRESCATKVYKEFSLRSDMKTKEEDVVMMDALNHALDEEMEKDPGVLVFGQDVALGKGGVFGITKNLSAKFGVNRCFNTPLAESTIVGIATGLSFDGFHRPVAEIQFADYSWTAMNQIINELSSIYYRSNGIYNCPVVIRMPYGGYIQGGPYHSQSIEGYLAHCPGLKIVIPSNAADAKMLLKASIRDPNPVIFLEHKGLYRQRAFCARKEPDENSYLALGKANVVKEGSDVTVVVWGMMVMMAVELSAKLQKEGISAEIIDLRTISPVDTETIINSVKKTGKLLIVHEAAKTCGFGAELAAITMEKAFAYLDAPVMRIAGKNCPVPYNKDLESAVLPQKEDIEKAIITLARY